MFPSKTPGQVRRPLPKGMAYLSLMSAPCLHDFTILRGLGDGSSGTVHVVKENDTGGLYALKAIEKRKLGGNKLKTETVITERNTLLDFRGDDFILQLRACFHDSKNYYLVTEYHPAGDLHTLLLLKGSPQNVVRFYMAELLIALEHIYAKRIIHRDIKPENLFIDNDGHLVLGDFGLACKLRVGENTVTGNDNMFGTPAYTPPEVFTGEPYGREIDLWAFGVMLYELLTGKEAFKSTTVSQDDPSWLAHLARNILRDEVEDSPHLTPDSSDLIGKLLRKSPRSRLHNIKEIKRHRFFDRIDWEALSNRSLIPPWIPTIGPADCPSLDCPSLTPGEPYSTEQNPDRDFSFRFSPAALTPAFQRHQRLFCALGGALPAVVNWVEGSTLGATTEVSSVSSSTSSVSYVEAVDAGRSHPVELHGPPVHRKNLQPLVRWARSFLAKRQGATRS